MYMYMNIGQVSYTTDVGQVKVDHANIRQAADFKCPVSCTKVNVRFNIVGSAKLLSSVLTRNTTLRSALSFTRAP